MKKFLICTLTLLACLSSRAAPQRVPAWQVSVEDSSIEFSTNTTAQKVFEDIYPWATNAFLPIDGLTELEASVASNTANIEINASNILVNSGGVETNAINIATNAAAIADIVQDLSQISTTKWLQVSYISTNSTSYLELTAPSTAEKFDLWGQSSATVNGGASWAVASSGGAQEWIDTTSDSFYPREAGIYAYSFGAYYLVTNDSSITFTMHQLEDGDIFDPTGGGYRRMHVVDTVGAPASPYYGAFSGVGVVSLSTNDTLVPTWWGTATLHTNASLIHWYTSIVKIGDNEESE